MTVTADIDLRPALGGARDQHRRPTCLGFATSSAHEFLRGAQGYYSIEFLHYHGVRRSHGDPGRGATPHAIAEALAQDGQPAERAWPYRSTTPTKAAWRPPLAAKVRTATASFGERPLADVLDALRAETVVVLVLSLTPAFYVPDAHHRVLVRANDPTTALHAVLAVGTGSDAEGSYVLVRNSWGAAWGHQGHAWLHHDYVQARMLATGVVT